MPVSTPSDTSTANGEAGGTGFSTGTWAGLGTAIFLFILGIATLLLWNHRKAVAPESPEPEELKRCRLQARTEGLSTALDILAEN